MEEDDLRSAKRTRGGRERLLEAATELFNQHGLAGTSLQMIADRLGVSKPALYHHFRSREDIVASLMVPVLEEAANYLELLEDLPFADRSKAAADFYCRFTIKHRRVINIVFFDRGALEEETSQTVDSLADGVAAALSGASSGNEFAIGQAKVYGAAALVSRSSDLSDEALYRLIAAVLGAVESEG